MQIENFGTENHALWIVLMHIRNLILNLHMKSMHFRCYCSIFGWKWSDLNQNRELKFFIFDKNCLFCQNIEFWLDCTLDFYFSDTWSKMDNLTLKAFGKMKSGVTASRKMSSIFLFSSAVVHPFWSTVKLDAQVDIRTWTLSCFYFRISHDKILVKCT